MRDALRVKGRHPALGFLVVFAGVDVEEEPGSAEVLKFLLGDDLHPDAAEQLLDRFMSGHQQRLNGSHTALGVDGAESLVGFADEGEGQLMAFGGPENALQDLPGEEGKVHAQDQATVEPSMSEAGQDAAERPGLPDFVGSNRHMKGREGFWRAYDEGFVHMRLEQIDGAVDQTPARKRQEGLVASHPPASTAGKDETAEPSAGLHRPLPPFFTRLMLILIISHPRWGTGDPAYTAGALFDRS